MFFIGIFIIIFLLFCAWLKSPTGRGKTGEWRVRRAIGKTKPEERFVFNDYMLERGGKSCQIDHIVINKKGVFVIETKNYSGRIYGNEKQQEWTQVLRYGRVKHKIYNPLKQNATHAYRIGEVLGKDIPIFSLVVFVQGNTHFLETDKVLSVAELKRTLYRGKDFLDIPKMREIYEMLLEESSLCTVNMKQHINRIRVEQENIANGFCPRCGGRLIKRDGKYGAFWGCSNYPKCKFTKNTRRKEDE